MIKEYMSNAAYHEHPAISSSDVKAVASTSLLHWKNKVWKDSPAFQLGTAVHSLVLEPHLNEMLRGPDTRRGNAWKDAQFAAETDGKTLLTSGDYDKAFVIADAVIKTGAGEKMQHKSTVNESSFFAIDPLTGLEIKCRPDSYDKQGGTIFDIKTTDDASPRGFARSVGKYEYALQAAFYMHVLTCMEMPAKRFIFVAVEKEAPFAVGVHELSIDYLDWAHKRMQNTLARIFDATEAGVYETEWPLVNKIDLPTWLQEPN